MYKFLLGIGFVLGVGVGLFRPVSRPYALHPNRIAINLAVSLSKSFQDNKYALGEKYLAEDLAVELRRQGFEVKLFSYEDTISNLNYRPGIDIYMRSIPELMLDDYHHYFDKDRIAVLFETIPYSLNEVKNAQIILTGSPKKNKEYRDLGLNSYFLPQFTRLDKFYYAPREEYKTRVLFIANQWPNRPIRKTVDFAIKTGVELTMYGASWDKHLDKEHLSWRKGEQIPNDELKYYYSSADIVLNDTRPDMIEVGFISNRIFDATACEAFVISDYMAEIEEIYGDSIPLYRTEEEFKQLIDYYLAHPEERREKAKRAHQITVERFGAEAFVRRMVDILRQYQENRGANVK